MSEYNASDTKAIRLAKRQARLAEAERREVILHLMSSPGGRNYIYDFLTRCHVFATSFAENSLTMAFAEGERNVGLQVLGDIMAFAPDQYIQMMREANDRHIAADRGHGGNREDSRGADSGWADDARGDDGDSASDEAGGEDAPY